MSKKRIKEDINKELLLRKLSLIGEYNGLFKRSQFLCLNLLCNHVWTPIPNDVLNHGSGCPNCNSYKVHTNKSIDMRFIISGRKIKRIGNVVNVMTDIVWECLNPKCNRNKWMACPNNVINQKSGCPLCKMGKFEKNVRTIIKTNFIINEMLYEVPHFVNGHKRKPDWTIKINDKPNIIVECNGPHHYYPKIYNKMSKEDAVALYEETKQRDIEMREYWKSKNIQLIEIIYGWKDDRILEELKKYIV